MVNRKTVSIRMNPHLWDNFRKFVFEKYGSLYGSVSVEMESMMKNWLNAHTNFTNSPGKLNPLGNRSERMAKEIIHFIQGKIDTFQTQRLFILRCIETVRGSDPRTIKKWFSYLHRHGHIKPLHGDMWEIL